MKQLRLGILFLGALLIPMLAVYAQEQSNPTKPFKIFTVSTETSTQEYESRVDYSVFTERPQAELREEARAKKEQEREQARAKKEQEKLFFYLVGIILYLSLPLIVAFTTHPIPKTTLATLRLDSKAGWWMYSAIFSVCSFAICLASGYGSGSVHRSAGLELFETLIIGSVPMLLIAIYGRFHDFKKALPRKVITALGFLAIFLPLPVFNVSGGEYLFFSILPLILFSLSIVDEQKDNQATQ